MRWDFGAIYKKIRKSKGLSQKEVCGNQLSRTSLSKIEACERVPNIENMIFLLNQIDMSLEEFRYICNYYQPSKKQLIFNKIYNHTSSTDTTELEGIQKDCLTYLKTHHDVPIQHINDTLTIVIHLRKHGLSKSSEEFLEATRRIWNYIEKQDEWYENDIKLLGTILYSYPIDYLPLVTDKLLRSLKKYQYYRNIKPLEVNLLANIAKLYLHHDRKDNCEDISSRLLLVAKDIKQYDVMAIAYIYLGICRGDDVLIDRGRALLRLTEETQLLEVLEKEIKNYR
ncbi:Rgg family transcriptional regulator [Streptococcus orisratti]|uniref:helix-turn-helix domain-containing protein n=1 Tax=Streptococcus TaxID=1301 RepID=UPI000373C84D|nr:Rgg/GadR/MutR family transcriptional regulator [Streptococcus orisratti]MCI7676642.1 helix-turn-helix domain-containing protein [Streptococcus orisratti]MDY4001266.1 helix-turn-helix domain-containing protein [Streptococcus orisratti]MDY5636325.1 helix-turn-helix domain-containing protein [Streptococcus orisratti]HEL2413438.1 helix-turn-helix domain-containing protein [Streptococcus suis]